MKKLFIFILFISVLTHNLNAQDKIILLNGDTILGKLDSIGIDLFRLTKLDGKSAIISNSQILGVIKSKGIENVWNEQKENQMILQSTGAKLSEAKYFHNISLALSLGSAVLLPLGLYSYNEASQFKGINQEKYKRLRSQGNVFLMVGITTSIGSFIFNEMAWKSIGEAGTKLNKSKVGLKLSPNNFGLCLNF